MREWVENDDRKTKMKIMYNFPPAKKKHSRNNKRLFGPSKQGTDA